MKARFALLWLTFTGGAVRLASSLSRSSAFNRVSHVTNTPASVCDYSASESIWARYMSEPKSGTLVFRGNGIGQGVGNVFAGLSNALMLAMVSRREFIVDYSIGSVQLSDIIPANTNGPTWKHSLYSKRCCLHASIKDFDFQEPHPAPADAVKMATDVTSYPVLCHSGNFGRGEQLYDLLAPNMSLAIGHRMFRGCSLNFLFDATKFKNELSSNAFNFVGHLRLGDDHMHRRDSRSWFADSTWGLHGNIRNAGAKVVECMQGVARSVPELQNHENCNIIILSDSSEMKRAIESLSKGRQHPCAVKVSRGTAMHSAKGPGRQQVQDMFTDLFSLSNADAAMTTHSGFSDIGTAMGPAISHHSYRLEDFLKGHHEVQSNGEAQQTFEDFCFSKASDGAARTSLERARARTRK